MQKTDPKEMLKEMEHRARLAKKKPIQRRHRSYTKSGQNLHQVAYHGKYKDGQYLIHDKQGRPHTLERVEVEWDIPTLGTGRPIDRGDPQENPSTDPDIWQLAEPKMKRRCCVALL